MKIIGFNGESRSGKTTAAGMVSDTVLSFAAPFKSMLRQLYRDNGLDEVEIERRIEGDLKDTPDRLFANRTPRDMMIWLGQSGRKQVYPEIWVNTVRSQLTTLLDNGHAGFVSISDVRQANEAEMIWSLGGVVIRLVGRGLHSGDAADNSNFLADEIWVNSGSLDDLRREVELLKSNL
jgi:hypothetical protein